MPRGDPTSNNELDNNQSLYIILDITRSILLLLPSNRSICKLAAWRRRRILGAKSLLESLRTSSATISESGHHVSIILLRGALSQSSVSSHSFLNVFADNVASQRYHLEVRAVKTTAMARSDRLPDEDKISGSSGVDRIDNTTMERDHGVHERDVKVG